MEKINKWIDHEFESSSMTTKEFVSFNNDYRNFLKKKMKNFDCISWTRGHFYCSSFWKNKTTGQIVYMNCSDVRFFPNEWMYNILIRTAKHDKDFTGGVNNYATLNNIDEIAEGLSTL